MLSCMVMAALHDVGVPVSFSFLMSLLGKKLPSLSSGQCLYSEQKCKECLIPSRGQSLDGE